MCVNLCVCTEIKKEDINQTKYQKKKRRREQKTRREVETREVLYMFDQMFWFLSFSSHLNGFQGFLLFVSCLQCTSTIQLT